MGWIDYCTRDEVPVALTDVVCAIRIYDENIRKIWNRAQIVLTRESIRNLEKKRWDRDQILQWLYSAVNESEYRNLQALKEYRDRNSFSPPYRKKPGKIYFAHSPEHGIVKIGCSENPQKRLNALKKIKGSSVYLVKIYDAPDGMYEAEHFAHSLFSSRRTEGEWFKIGPDSIKLFDWYLRRSGKGLKEIVSI